MVQVLNTIGKFIGSSVLELKPSGEDWYTIVRATQPLSTRYSIKFYDNITTYVGVLYDFKEDKTSKLYFKDIGTFKCSSSDSKKPESVSPHIQNIWNSCSPYKEHEYLVNHKIPGTYNHLRLNSKGDIAVSYVACDIPNIVIGIKYYGVNGKYCEKGSTLKGSVAFHRHDKVDTVYITEGLADALSVLLSVPIGDVVETGGLNNVKNALPYFIQKYSSVVLVGENDSVTAYNNLARRSHKIRVVFPPVGKDISDFFQENEPETVAKILEVSAVYSGSYRPLGFLGKSIVIYSKTLRAVSEFNINSWQELLSLGLGITGALTIKGSDKSMIIEALIEDCAKIGQYSAENERGAGLFKYKTRHIYNTGQDIYNVDTLEHLSFPEVIRDDFLVVSRQTKLGILQPRDYDPQGLIELLRCCDWKEKFYGDVLCGFLVQSVFSGATEFSPHLWIKSNLPKAGKSWLSRWIRDNLFPDSPKHDGSGTTVKGFRQSLRFYSGLTFVDEFAEEDSIYQDSAKGIMQTMRSGSTGDTPITLGTKQQVPININVKFSALLTCITGQTNIAPQDYERIIFMELHRPKESVFLKEQTQKFYDFANKYKPEDFLYYCLKIFPRFNSLAHQYTLEFSERKPSIGHKARGFGAVVAGFHLFSGDKSKANSLVDKILGSKISEPLDLEDYKIDPFEELLTQIISRSDTGLEKDYPLHHVIKIGFFYNYGLKYDSDNNEITMFPKLFRPITSKYYKGINLGIFCKALKSSRYFKRDVIRQIDRKRTRSLSFEMPEHFLNTKQL